MRPCLLPSAGFTVGGDQSAGVCMWVPVWMPKRPDYAATCRYGYIEPSAVKTSPWTRDGVSLCVALPQARLSARIQPAWLSHATHHPTAELDVMQRRHRRSN
jgi:hypothetical protein